MHKLQKLIEVIQSESLAQPPQRREFAGEWSEVVIGIGSDHTCYITIPDDALKELVSKTSRKVLSPEVNHPMSAEFKKAIQEVNLNKETKMEGNKNEQIENNFKYHSPKEGQQEKYVMLREKGKELAYDIDMVCPVSREKALAITKLEEVIMWANASIARNE